MEQQTQLKRKRGRPFGTVKYKDSNGKPIGVYEWRKKFKDIWLDKKRHTESYPLTAETQHLLNLLIETTGKTREEILNSALKALLREKIK